MPLDFAGYPCDLVAMGLPADLPCEGGDGGSGWGPPREGAQAFIKGGVCPPPVEGGAPPSCGTPPSCIGAPSRTQGSPNSAPDMAGCDGTGFSFCSLGGTVWFLSPPQARNFLGSNELENKP